MMSHHHHYHADELLELPKTIVLVVEAVVVGIVVVFESPLPLFAKLLMCCVAVDINELIDWVALLSMCVSVVLPNRSPFITLFTWGVTS